MKDNLTPLGAALHPPRSLALVADSRLPIPMQAKATSHSQTSPTTPTFLETMAKKSPLQIFPCALLPSASRVRGEGIDVLAGDGLIAMA